MFTATRPAGSLPRQTSMPLLTYRPSLSPGNPDRSNSLPNRKMTAASGHTLARPAYPPSLNQASSTIPSTSPYSSHSELPIIIDTLPLASPAHPHPNIDGKHHIISTKILSTPPHVYVKPDPNAAMPYFTAGRDRFPARQPRWHPPGTTNPNRYEVLPGTFELGDFRARWNGGIRYINDDVIENISHESIYTGIHYLIDVNPIGWKNHQVLRGDVIVFRGFESSTIKYIITWKRSSDVGNGFAYVQANAFDEHQYSLESGNADWPTIGFLVPADLCCVIQAPSPPIPYDPLSTEDDSVICDPGSFFSRCNTPSSNPPTRTVIPQVHRQETGNPSPNLLSRTAQQFKHTISHIIPCTRSLD